MRLHAGDDLLAFLLLRHMGFRGSDAVKLTWQEIHFDRREIERVTQKRKKNVVIPITSELLFALECEHAKRNPLPQDVILLNPETGTRMLRHRLYMRVVALGTRAGLEHAHPHRFRDTLAVEMLCAGAGISRRGADTRRHRGDNRDALCALCACVAGARAPHHGERKRD
jgi:integrase